MCKVKLKFNGPGPSLGIHFLACNCDTKSVSLNVFEKLFFVRLLFVTLLTVLGLVILYGTRDSKMARGSLGIQQNQHPHPFHTKRVNTNN